MYVFSDNGTNLYIKRSKTFREIGEADIFMGEWEEKKNEYKILSNQLNKRAMPSFLCSGYSSLHKGVLPSKAYLIFLSDQRIVEFQVTKKRYSARGRRYMDYCASQSKNSESFSLLTVIG